MFFFTYHGKGMNLHYSSNICRYHVSLSFLIFGRSLTNQIRHRSYIGARYNPLTSATCYSERKWAVSNDSLSSERRHEGELLNEIYTSCGKYSFCVNITVLRLFYEIRLFDIQNYRFNYFLYDCRFYLKKTWMVLFGFIAY